MKIRINKELYEVELLPCGFMATIKHNDTIRDIKFNPKMSAFDFYHYLTKINFNY